MLKKTYPYYLANVAVAANTDLEVTDKFSGEVATRVAMADAAAIDKAIGYAVDAMPAMREFPPFKRQAVLEHCVSRFRERYDELAMALCIEAGKPINDARGEVTRLIDTFKVAAEEAVRIDGEIINLEISPRAKGYHGYVKRVPIGPCSFISPFNFPLNLTAHKVAPALAVGVPFVLKSCIGVQRILVHSNVYDALREKLIAKTKSLIMGDPKDEKTFVGPMISESESKRLAGWMENAVLDGAKIVAGGKVEGANFEATLLEDVKRDSDLCRKEAFGPVAILERFDDFEKALEAVNDSDFGLQAGVFTDSLAHAHQAWDRLDVGGVVINDVPSFRVDNMPYGGVKDSGLGREGIRYAIEDMTELRLMVMRETW